MFFMFWLNAGFQPTPVSRVDVKFDYCDLMFLISLPVPGLKGAEWTELGSWVTSFLESAVIVLYRYFWPTATPNLFYNQNPNTRDESAFDELDIASTVVREELENKQKTDHHYFSGIFCTFVLARSYQSFSWQRVSSTNPKVIETAAQWFLKFIFETWLVDKIGQTSNRVGSKPVVPLSRVLVLE